MTKLSQKPLDKPMIGLPSRFSRFYLSENPFPAEPAVNKDADDPRINGSIYESDIRSIEYNKIRDQFLVQPQSSPNHLRLGYIIDQSYVGRGNGKSAFLVNLQQNINENFCLDISEGINKCFAIYVTPEQGGRTKTFSSFVDCIFGFILQSQIIKVSLASLRLDAIVNAYPGKAHLLEVEDESLLIANLNNKDWFQENNIDPSILQDEIFNNEYLESLPPEFPLHRRTISFFQHFCIQEDFLNYYQTAVKKPKDKLDFLFSHLVQLFLAAGFNGCYILVDNFEQIAIPQSAKLKLDFAFELRSCLYDGSFVSSRLGFFNFLLTFHVGVQRLISEAWSASGMENRSPISSPGISNHIVQFEKLSADHVALLLRKYLSEYRLPESPYDELYPFNMEAISLIGQRCQFNASNILRTAYGLLEKIANRDDTELIDANFVNSMLETYQEEPEKPLVMLEAEEPVDLQEKAQK